MWDELSPYSYRHTSGEEKGWKRKDSESINPTDGQRWCWEKEFEEQDIKQLQVSRKTHHSWGKKEQFGE